MAVKRVLIFSLAYEPFIGGAEVAVKEIIDRLFAADCGDGGNYEFEIITANLDRCQDFQVESGRVLVRRLNGSKYLFPWRAARRAAKLHRERPYDLAWAIMANQAGIAASIFKKRFPQVPLILTLQEGDQLDSLTYRLRLLAPKWFKVFHRPDRITVISSYLEKWARQMGSTCPIDVIPNGVDTQKFNNHLKHREKNVPDQDDGKIIIHTGRLVAKNGLDVLIRALTYLPNTTKLWLLGGGREECPLRKLVATLGLEKRVEFFGQVPPAEVGDYLNRADVFARPSRSEGLGNSFLEAMAVGIPVVGTQVGGIPDFLKAGETGWVCQTDDPASVARQIFFILDPKNQALVEKIITNARTLIFERYDWSKIASQMKMVFSKSCSIFKSK